MSDIEKKTVEIHGRVKAFFAGIMSLIFGSIKCALLAILKFTGHLLLLFFVLLFLYVFYLIYNMGGEQALEFLYLKLHYIISTGKIHP